MAQNEPLTVYVNPDPNGPDDWVIGDDTFQVGLDTDPDTDTDIDTDIASTRAPDDGE